MSDASPISAPGFPISARVAQVALTLAAASSGLLAWQHLAGGNLPGCGFLGDCAKVTSSAWSTIPGLGWPIAYVGFAYFASLAIRWSSTCAGGVPVPVRALLALGSLGSLTFITVMATMKAWCVWCLVTHILNLTGTLFAWRGPAAPARGASPRLPLSHLAAAFLILTGVLAGADLSFQSRRQRLQANELSASLQKMSAAPAPAGFSGRYVVGATDARVRIVIFSDYQCPHCKDTHRALEALRHKRPDVSIAMRHFPLCTACNPNIPTDIHPNACRAARTAEAAGQLGGVAAFDGMHRWLFDVDGSFTDTQARAQAASLGLDPEALLRLADDDRTLAPVQHDIADALSLGIASTPMVFVNGVELRGYDQPGALEQAAQAAAAAPSQPGADHPVDALTRTIEEWRSTPVVAVPPAAMPHALGPADPSGPVVEVSLFGSYQQPQTREADAAIRRALSSNPRVRYTFRSFPLSKSCNPRLPQDAFPMACRLARLAEAAARAGGDAVFWNVHDWLLKHDRDYTDNAFRAFAEGLGLDGSAMLKASKEDASIAATIDAEIAAGWSLQFPSVPTVYVNGKALTRVSLPGVNADVLSAVIAEAASSPQPAGR